MANEKPDVSPAPSIVPIPDVTAGPEEAVRPAFQTDAFLGGETKNVAEEKLPSLGAPPQIVKRGGVGFLTALAMSVLAAGGGAYLALFAQSRADIIHKSGMANFIPVSAPQIPSSNNNAGLQQLMTRVAALEAELLAIQTRLGAPTPVIPATNLSGAAQPDSSVSPSAIPQSPSVNLADVGVMKGELAGVSGRITAIETRLAALDPTGAGGAIVAGLQADIAGLKSVIASLQQQAASAPSPATTFALITLAEASNRSGPFMVEFETLRAAMPGVSEVLALEPFARSGAPTRQVLEERFAALGPAVAASAVGAKKETGFLAWVKALFSDMVKVQEAPNANSATSTSAIERAKVKLDQGDYSGAVEELGAIAGPPVLVTDWVTSAKKRLELESRINAVRGAAARAHATALVPQAPLITGQIPAMTNKIIPAPAPPPAPVPAAVPPASKIQGLNP